MYLKYLGKDNSSHEVVSTLYKINVSLLELLKMDIQNLIVQHKKSILSTNMILKSWTF